ncbi:MAG TPA: DUF4097 family beta strand repeat-containing protein [Cyclobacteriaceae bacterium]
MKKKFGMIALALVIAGAVSAQDFKLSKSTGTLDISEVNHVTIEGHTGNDIIFSSRDHNRDDDDRAKGLRAISSMGLEDNTGLGLSVIDRGTTIEVRQLKKMDGPDIKILVPKGVKVSFSHTSPHGEGVEVKNFEGEIEISTVHNEVTLTNVSGPMNVKTVHGDIDVTFGASLKGPISINSVHAHVDVAIPVGTKADFRLGSTWGEIFVDPDFKLEIDKSGSLVKYSNKLSGKMNGGGTEIELASTHDNVYLRKK